MDMDVPLRVLIADGDGRVRRALRALLEAEVDIAVVGEAATVEDVLAGDRALRPTLIVLDLLLPAAEDGLRLLGLLAGRPIIALTARGGLRDAALHAGACAFVEKGAGADTLLAAIRAAASAPRARPSGPG